MWRNERYAGCLEEEMKIEIIRNQCGVRYIRECVYAIKLDFIHIFTSMQSMDVSLIRKAQDFIIAFCSFQLARKNAFMYVCSVYNIAFHVLNV